MNDKNLTLIGMYDSPYVRRVAITLHCYQMPYVHENLSVFGDADKVRQFNPLGRVPVLRVDSEDLIDSAAIIDYLDECAGPERTMTPGSGEARRRELRRTAVSLGACDKAVGLIYERHKRAAETHDPLWESRLTEQLLATCQWLDREIPALDGKLSQAQLTTAVMLRFTQGTLPDVARRIVGPELIRLGQDCEATPAFQSAAFSSD